MALRTRPTLLLTAALALAGCGSGNNSSNLDTLDNSLTSANATDPALAAALQSQIMVDPKLSQQANGDAVRPPTQPYSAPVPDPGVAATPQQAAISEKLQHAPAPSGDCPSCKTAEQATTLAGIAARQKDGRTSGCVAGLRYSAAWATRLPRDLPLYPQARVSEAAGTSTGGCALRIVSFSAGAPIQAMIDWYYTRARQAGYGAEHQSDGTQHVLGGTRARDGGAFVAYFTTREDGGTDVDLIANNGI